MNKRDLIGMGLKNLWRRKLRTILTIISVMIGATSIVVMLSLGFGLQKQNESMLENIGELTSLTVMPRYNYGPGGMDNTTVLDDKLIDKIEKVDHVERVIPVLSVEATIRAKKYVYFGQVVGIRPEDQEGIGIKVSEGRLLEPGDKDHILIGEAALRWGFERMTSRGPDYSSGRGEERAFDPFNTKITLDFDDPFGSGFDPFEETATKKSKTYKLQTVGVMEENGRYGFSIILPMEAAKKYKEEGDKFRASLYGEPQQGGNQRPKFSYSELQVKVDALENMEGVRETLVNELELEAYGDGQWIQELEGTTKTIQAVLGGIGSIALIVAAIGIANTMIMSTYERTREIGVMKVIGASVRDIRNLFLVESAMIGLIGGIFGILQSLGISHLMNKYLAQGLFGEAEIAISIIPPWLIVVALFFSALVGLISGYFPAIRATKLSAIEAIRTE